MCKVQLGAELKACKCKSDVNHQARRELFIYFNFIYESIRSYPVQDRVATVPVAVSVCVSHWCNTNLSF